MVVGESGLGKSTLINSLFLTDLYSPENSGPVHRIKETVQVDQSKVLIKEGSVQLLLPEVDPQDLEMQWIIIVAGSLLWTTLIVNVRTT